MTPEATARLRAAILARLDTPEERARTEARTARLRAVRVWGERRQVAHVENMIGLSAAANWRA